MHNCVFVCIKPLSYRNGSISMLLYFVNCSVFCTYIKYSNIFYQLSKVLFCKFCHLHLYYFSLYLHFYIVQYIFPRVVISLSLAHCFFYGFTGLKVPNNPFIFQSTLLFLYTPLLTRQILTGIKMPSKTPKE